MPNHQAELNPAFSLLVKPGGASCNLRCQYCFYLDKEKIYPGSNHRMTQEVLREYIKQYLHSQPSGEVCVAWQGGEPTLLGINFFQQSINFVKKYKQPGQFVSYSLQTNGTLLDDAWCAFFKKHDFLVGISIDGTSAMHNAYRVNQGGQGSFTQVKRGWDLLKQYQVDTNILCAVSAANASYPLDTYHFFRDVLGARFIQYIPIVVHNNLKATEPLPTGQSLQDDAQVRPCSVKPDQYGRFLNEIFDEWVKQDVGEVFIQNFEAALASWCRLPASTCIYQEVCGRSLVLEHNGDLYSCDHFVDASHRLGNILDTPLMKLVKSAQLRQFGLNKRELLPGLCVACDVRFACHGECQRNRFIPAQDPNGYKLNYLCPSYQLFFHHIDRPMRRMAELLRQGKAASEIMHTG